MCDRIAGQVDYRVESLDLLRRQPAGIRVPGNFQAGGCQTAHQADHVVAVGGKARNQHGADQAA